MLSVGETCLRIYANKLAAQAQSDQPLINIPLAAIDGVVEHFDIRTIVDTSQPTSDMNFYPLINNKFAVTLREDFLRIYLLQEYHRQGLPDETIDSIIEDGLYCD